MHIETLTPSLGAVVTGVDLRAAAETGFATTAARELISDLRQTWLKHLVLVVRDQQLDSEHYLAFARALGEPDTYPFLQGLPGFPTITEVLKKADETVNFGGVWHTDTIYQPSPPMATLLYARELPPVGGDTLFANQYLAYETLSDGLRSTLGGLKAVSIAGKGAVASTRQPRIGEKGTDTDVSDYHGLHPVVRQHPETQRPCLYLSPAHAVRFEHWSEAESAALLQWLFRHQVRDEFCCRHQWRTGDIALWDNRCTLHYPVNDYHGHRRLLHRITLRGDQPVGLNPG